MIKKCLVPIKRVIDPYVTPRVKSDQSGVETEHVKMAMNPFDEIAIEEAVRLKEKGQLEEIIAVSIGPQATQETLRQALARGADKAILIQTEQSLNPLSVARTLLAIIGQQQCDLVIMGKQAIDGDNNQTGQLLAGLLGWSQGTFISKLELQENQAQVTREVDGGLETLKLTLPAVLTTDLRLNEPRYISLPNVMKAKKKPLETVELSSLNIEVDTSYEVLKVEQPPERPPGVKLGDVQALVDKLKNEAKVL